MAEDRVKESNGSGPGKDEVPEPYNFSRAGQISHEQMWAIGTVNDLLVRNQMHTLGAWLRTHFQVKMTASKQMSYADFLARMKGPTYVCSIRMEPLGTLGLLELDLSLASPIIDLPLGGVGRAVVIRDLTDAELRVRGIALGRARRVRMGEHRGAQIQAERSQSQDLLNSLS